MTRLHSRQTEDLHDTYSANSDTRRMSGKRLLAVLLAFCTLPLCGAGFFSGTFEGSINPEFYISDNWYRPTIDSYFSGQLDFSDSFGIRGVLSTHIKSGDFFIPVLKYPADLFLGLLSMYFSSQVNGYRHTIAFFAGENAALGTDTWLRQYLGVEKISSFITRPKIGVWNAGVYPVSGIGMSYTLRFKQPQALDFYIYGKRATNALGVETDRVAFDLRYAGRWDFGVIELFGGAELDSGTQIIGINNARADLNAYFRAGFTGYFGKPYEGHVYVQAAIVGVSAYTRTLSVKDNFYMLIEPRFVFGMNRLIFSLFNIPEASELNKTMLFNPMPMGAAASFIFSNSDWQGFEAGVTACLSATAVTPNLNIDFNINNVALNIVPFVKWSLGPGLMTLSGNITPLEPFKSAVTPLKNHILTINIGYTVSL